jgi:hypothetical protein
MVRRSPSRAIALALIIGLFANACGGSGGQEAADADTGDTPATSAPTTETARVEPDLTLRDAGLDLPRTLEYAGAELTVARATFSNATPQSYGDQDPFIGDDELLFVEISTAYRDGYPGSDARFELQHLGIRTADGRHITARALDQSGVRIQATTTTTATVFFSATADDLVDAALVFDDGDHLAGILPLHGSIPDSGYPVREQADLASPVVFPSGCGRSTAQVRIEALEWDIDAGVDHDGQRVVTGRSARATNGARLVRAAVTTIAGPDRCGGTFFNYENVRLSIDGVVHPPLNTPTATLQNGEGTTLIFGFEIPLDADELTLIVGAPDSDPWRVAVSVPAQLP